MPYAKPADVSALWNKVLTTELTVDEVALLIDQAGAFVDAALARRYIVPVASTPETTPPIIRWITATLALLEIVDRSPSTPDWVMRKIQRAEKQLDMLASGDLSIPGTTMRTDLGSMQSTTEGYVPVFGGVPSISERWDPQRAEDEWSERNTS